MHPCSGEEVIQRDSSCISLDLPIWFIYLRWCPGCILKWSPKTVLSCTKSVTICPLSAAVAIRGVFLGLSRKLYKVVESYIGRCRSNINIDLIIVMIVQDHSVPQRIDPYWLFAEPVELSPTDGLTNITSEGSIKTNLHYTVRQSPCSQIIPIWSVLTFYHWTKYNDTPLSPSNKHLGKGWLTHICYK